MFSGSCPYFGGITGGLGLCEKEHLRVGEVMGRDWSIFASMAVHELVAFAINKYGSDELKLKYLPKMASGECVGAFCLSEERR